MAKLAERPARAKLPSSIEPVLMSMTEVVAFVRLSDDTIYRLIDKGKFPAPLRVGSKLLRWRTADLKRWVEKMAPAKI
jgi:excisionase family DNA binding protein